MSAPTPTECRILVIEDLPADVVLIHHALRKAGFVFRTRRVDSEEQFLHELDRQTPDLILSDHGVPGFDGFRALELAREKIPDVPFVFVSADVSEDAARVARKKGATAYVTKSALDQLGPTVARALNRCREQERIKELERELKLAREQLRDLEGRILQLEAEGAEMEEFATRIALSSRPPLQELESLCERLDKTRHEQIDPENHGYLRAMAESARTLSKLNDDLLTFSRIGYKELTPLPFGLRETVDEAIQDLWREVEGRTIEWEIGPLPQVSADPVLLLLAMTHLIGNALQFTRLEGRARIEIGSRLEPQETVVYVKDNGVGLPEGAHKEVFGAFKRAGNAMELEGAGLGLAIVRRIVKRHGGRAWAEGAPGNGATFYFTLPVGPEPAT